MIPPCNSWGGMLFGGRVTSLCRIDAVDGQNISLDSLEARQVVESSALARAKRAKRLGLYSIVHDEENQLVNFDDHFTEGAVACAMSHHKALTKVPQCSKILVVCHLSYSHIWYYMILVYLIISI